MHQDLNPGDIVLVMFPYVEGPANKPHPCLVLESDDHVVYLAYGTSARVDVAANLNTAVVVVDQDDLRMASLHKPTAFHLDRRARVGKIAVCRKLGRLPSHKYSSLFRAAVAVGLLR